MNISHEYSFRPAEFMSLVFDTLRLDLNEYT